MQSNSTLAAKNSNVEEMANWLESIPRENLSAELGFDQSLVKTYTSDNWKKLSASIRANTQAKVIDMILINKHKQATQVAYVVYQDMQWQSMPAEDVKLLYSVDLLEFKPTKPKKGLKFIDFKQAYPASPVYKKLVDLGVK